MAAAARGAAAPGWRACSRALARQPRARPAVAGRPASTPTAGGGVSAASCQTICDRVVACIPEGGCPNFARLPDAQRDQVVAQCVPACRTGLTEEALSAVNAATCTEIFQEISAGEADVEAFCALEPASAADCTAFCEQLRGCGSELTDELCQLTCLYGAGVRCIRQNGTCQAPECGALFPSE